MKVEVDADELCELRAKVNSYDFDRRDYRKLSEEFERENKELKRKLVLKAQENAELACERPSVDLLRKLKEERDWWREQAVYHASIRDDNEGVLCEEFTLCQPNTEFESHYKSLVDSALEKGYEVP